MAEVGEFTQYSTVRPWMKNLPSWVPPAHQERIGSYAVYKSMYWSHIDTNYKVMNRGLDAEDEPLYVPSSRIMIDTVNQYVGKGLRFQIDPVTGTPASQEAARVAFDMLFTRERFFSKYNSNKREGLIKGDWCWHIVADEDKEPTTRISILPVKADSYFPTFEDELVEGGDPTKVMQVRLVELVMVGDEERVHVQTYDRFTTPGVVLSSLEEWKPDEWFNPEKTPLAVINPPTPLPAGITTIPVYHVPNYTETGEPFGSSEMRGLEKVFAAINQGATDEDLAIALMGLGVYATDEPGSPVDPATGSPRSWFIYPGAVLENSKGLHKVDGITTVEPYNDHLKRLENYVGDSSGATDAARGRLEVQEAESGVALIMRLSPTLTKAEEKDRIIQDVHDQMFYDLVQQWFPVVEGLNFIDVTVRAAFGDKLPVNRKAEVDIVGALVTFGILSKASARTYLAKKGFNELFADTEGDLVLAEMAAEAQATMGADPTSTREAAETDPGAVDGPVA